MPRQLTLIESKTSWRLDDRTREVGRRGIAEARAQLEAHRPTPADKHRPTAA